MNNKGFVKLPRDIANKPWYNHNGTLRVYIELLINAAWKDFEYNGATLKKGQFITSVGKLAERCQLSVQQTRTALSHLKSTNTITIDTTPKFSIITILEEFSAENVSEPVNSLANNQSNTPPNNRNRKEEKENEIEIKEKEEPSSPPLNPPDSSITRDALIERYGIENVIAYERRLSEWKSAKGITGSFDDLKTLAKWLYEDKRQKPQSSSFSPDAVMQRIINRYKRE